MAKATKTKVFTRNVTTVKLAVLLSQNKEAIQNKTLTQIYSWVRGHEGFDFEGEDSLNLSGVKTTLKTLGIEPKKEKPTTNGERRDRVRTIAASIMRIAVRIEKSIGAEPGTILTADEKELLESL